jgi:4-aminobutyrate aminotransferase-like enzyme
MVLVRPKGKVILITWYLYFSKAIEYKACANELMCYQAVNPIPVSKAKGIYFWDTEGKRYTDFNSQLMCVNIGHQHPKVVQAIKDQADELCFAAPSMGKYYSFN